MSCIYYLLSTIIETLREGSHFYCFSELLLQLLLQQLPPMAVWLGKEMIGRKMIGLGMIGIMVIIIHVWGLFSGGNLVKKVTLPVVRSTLKY